MQNEGTERERQPLSSTGREMASRLQSIRDILTSDRDSGLSADQQRAALDVVDSEIAERLTTERDGTTHTMHRLVDNAVNDRYNHLLERHGSTSPSSIARSRRRLNRPLDRIQRQTDRMHRLHAASRSDAQDQSSSNLSQLSPLHPSRTRQASDEQDSDVDLHHTRDGKPVRKRRKLDDGTAESVRVLLAYGVEGTLLPGNLNMVVLDMEGNSDAQSPTDQLARARLFAPDNRETYRAKRHHCDILMKHTGGHPFALSKLIVRLPKRDYEAPPLQGMVFVSMNRETLLSQASHYNSYFPVSHSHHRRRYDSYRPSVDYMRSARSPRPAYRPRRPSDHLTQDTPWYDSRISLSEPAEIPTIPGIRVSLESVIDSEDSPSSGPRSPRPWEQAHDYTRRAYIDRYRPQASARTRDRASLAALEIPPLTPTSSEDEDEDQDQDQDRSQSNPDDHEETPFSRGVTDREFEEALAEAGHRNFLDQTRNRRDGGEGYSYFPPQAASRLRRDQGAYNDDEETHSEEQIAAIEAALVRRGYDVDALRRRRSGRNPATGANETNINPQVPPQPISPHRPYPPFHSMKRLPGCTGMLQGQSPHFPSDRDSVVPHATFSVGRDGAAGVAVKFSPEV